METIWLHIGEERTPVVIGSGLLPGLRDLQHRNPILIVDENVLALHGEKFTGFRCITVPSGEQHKTLSFSGTLFRKLIELEADRSSFIIGVGGGLVTDLAGFVASTFMRGLPFGFISSTLLGQVDASIGGKNGVNLDGFKNMVGVIRQPEFVWCDLDLLSTLDDQEYLSGVAEVIKYGAIRDGDFFSWLEEKHQDVIDKLPEALERTIAAAAKMKIAIVESDVNEKGDRKLLNFGHTFGHAVEKLSGMLHGYAVSIGMVMAARLSVRLGFLAASEYERLAGLLDRTGLPVRTSLAHDEIYETLLKDKKRSGEQIHFILLRRLGEAFIHPIGLLELKKMMNDLH